MRLDVPTEPGLDDGVMHRLTPNPIERGGNAETDGLDRLRREAVRLAQHPSHQHCEQFRRVLRDAVQVDRGVDLEQPLQVVAVPRSGWVLRSSSAPSADEPRPVRRHGPEARNHDWPDTGSGTGLRPGLSSSTAATDHVPRSSPNSAIRRHPRLPTARVCARSTPRLAPVAVTWSLAPFDSGCPPNVPVLQRPDLHGCHADRERSTSRSRHTAPRAQECAQSAPAMRLAFLVRL